MAPGRETVRVFDLAALFAALVLVAIGLHLGQAVFMPVVFALFVIALTAPLKAALAPRIGKSLAMVTAVLVAIAVITLFTLLLLWGFGRIASWALANLPRLQAVYSTLEATLTEFDIALEAILPQRFDPMWIVSPVLGAFSQLSTIANFLLLVFVFVVLGLTELDGTARRLKRIEASHSWLRLSEISSGAARDFGRYMKVRLVVSAVDSVICYFFLRLVGLDEPLAWAVLIGLLNFIPFIGPLIAAIGIGFFAAAQFADFGMAILAVTGVVGINFVLGSYIEPIVAGSALKMSAFLVLFSVFLWALIWGIPGAFIGVQITIVTLSVMRLVPSTAWLADLLSGGDETG